MRTSRTVIEANLGPWPFPLHFMPVLYYEICGRWNPLCYSYNVNCYSTCFRSVVYHCPPYTATHQCDIRKCIWIYLPNWNAFAFQLGRYIRMHNYSIFHLRWYLMFDDTYKTQILQTTKLIGVPDTPCSITVSGSNHFEGGNWDMGQSNSWLARQSLSVVVHATHSLISSIGILKEIWKHSCILNVIWTFGSTVCCDLTLKLKI